MHLHLHCFVVFKMFRSAALWGETYFSKNLEMIVLTTFAFVQRIRVVQGSLCHTVHSLLELDGMWNVYCRPACHVTHLTFHQSTHTYCDNVIHLSIFFFPISHKFALGFIASCLHLEALFGRGAGLTVCNVTTQ